MTSAQLNKLSNEKTSALVKSVFGQNFWTTRSNGSCRVVFNPPGGGPLSYELAGEGSTWSEAINRAARVCGLAAAA